MSQLKPSSGRLGIDYGLVPLRALVYVAHARGARVWSAQVDVQAAHSIQHAGRTSAYSMPSMGVAHEVMSMGRM